jgi:Cu+-exporting ATPase
MSNQDLLHQPGTRVVELDIEGMTCASCVNRVEKKLGKLEGVQALVNLPLESAHVTVAAGITNEQLVETVNAAGYKATVRQPTPAPEAAAAANLRPRLVLAALLTVPGQEGVGEQLPG